MLNPQIKTFLVVAESGSFSKAAEALFITPTAVMKQINSLEDHLNLSLFKRTNQGLVLTSAGKSVLQDAKYMVDYSARAVEKARDVYERERHKSIRIGVSFMTPARFILDLWENIQALAPNLKVELIPFENTPENARGILCNLGKQIDVVAGIYDAPLQEERNFQVLYLREKKMMFAVPVNTPLAKKERLSVSDLKESGVLLIEGYWCEYVNKAKAILKENGVPMYGFTFFCVGAYNQAAKAGIPIIAIDDWASVHPLMTLKEVEWDCVFPYGIAYSNTPSDHVLKFIKVIEKIIKR